ncbi:MAG: 3-methyl-2-oxobutanoate hydroxymethyltransferase [Methylacidiphilales bacterium]|nr:3-methyl-2-oxobutanoate hydroxymethyltransferase [Candidatus Methylacidiphilales bacterium]
MRLTIHDINQLKKAKKKIVCATSYDASFAQILDSHVDIQLVGDSLGMVVQGHQDTIAVSLEEMVYHTKCVVRGSKKSMVMADTPFLSCRNVEQTFITAHALLAEGATILKIEHASIQPMLIQSLSEQGIAVCAHIGLRPQHILKKGVYQYEGVTSESSAQLFEYAKHLEMVGACMILLECVPAKLALDITNALQIPVIGIGSGKDCDGQILVTYDIIGLSAKAPSFSKNYLSTTTGISQALSNYAREVREGSFPDQSHIKY